MKVIIEELRTKKGGEEDRKNLIKSITNSKYPISELVLRETPKHSIGLIEFFASSNHIPIKKFTNDEQVIKNMAEYADALITVWDGNRKDIKEMIKAMNNLGKPVFLYLIDKEKDY